MVDPQPSSWPIPNQLVLVIGSPRSGVCFAASQLAQHPDTLLLDGNNGMAEAWLCSQLDGAAPDSPDSPAPLGGATLRESAQLALTLIYDAPPPAPGPSQLILPLPQLLSDADKACRLLGQAIRLQPRPQLLEVVRDRQDVVSSLARFPHLTPDLPDPWAEPDAFRAAAEQLWQSSRDHAEQLRRDGWEIPQVRYEELVLHGPARLWSALGLAPVASVAQRRLHGISPSLCFRERRLDHAGLGRGNRQEQVSAAASDPEPVGSPPLIATGRGGSGTRLLTLLLQGLGVHIGHSLNPSGDSVEWADLIYEMSLASLAGHPGPWRGSWSSELIQRARCVAPASGAGPWAFKLPEAMLVLPQLTRIWPSAPVIHLVRHPVDTCLRRSHMTSRLNNPIGRATLQQSFAALGLKNDPASAPAYWCNAVSWWFQLEQLQRCRDATAARGQPWIELRYEDICADPQREADRLADQLGLRRVPMTLPVNPIRSRRPDRQDPRALQVWKLCGPIAMRYGYALNEEPLG